MHRAALICLILFFSILQTHADHRKNIKFEHLTADQGLAQNNIQSIMQDKTGYMWFGTQDGLSRYDGYSFLNYTHDPADSNSVSNNSVFSIFEDETSLWIGNGDDLNILNKFNGSFAKLPVKGATNIVRDSSGVYWIGSLLNGLYAYNPAGDSLFRYTPKNSTLSCDRIFCLYKDKDGNILIGTQFGGLNLLKRENGKISFTNFTHDPQNPYSVSSNTIASICQDSSGNYWLGTDGRGLNRLDKSGKFINFVHDPKNKNSLPGNKIYSIVYDHYSKSLWIGTYNNGLSRLSQDENGKFIFTNYRHDPTDPNSLSNNFVNQLYLDKNRTLWIGTSGNGVDKLSLPKINFRKYSRQNGNPSGLAGNSVWSFFQDPDGKIWVGTNRGVSCLQERTPSSARFANYNFFEAEDPGKHFQVRKLLEEKNGVMWLGILGKGLAKFNYNTGQIRFFPEITESLRIPAQFLYTICDDQSGNLWLGGNGTGLSRYDKKSGKYYYLNIFREAYTDSLHKGWVCVIHRDGKGILWLGTWNEGLARYNPQNRSIRFFIRRKDDPQSINNNGVLSIHESKRDPDILWLGTYGGGLNRFDKRTQTFSHVTVKEGLPNNVIYGIIEDNHNNLWLSTNKGLAMYNPESGAVKIYTQKDGLIGNEFNMGAYFKSREGEIFFGGNNGFISFFPEEVINPYPPKIVFTSFKRYGKKIHSGISLNSLKKIEIPYYKRNVFSFEFVALHYKNSKKNVYAYKMEGFDPDWVYCGTNREAIYMNLDPGKYTFRVKAANCDGVWNEKGIFMDIIILPPFWKTHWFITLSGIMIFMTLFLAHRLRLKQMIRLERAKAEEREKIRRKMATDFHDELGHRVIKISLLSKMLSSRLNKNKPAIKQYLEQMQENADNLFEEMKNFVWELDPQKDTVYDLMSQLKNFSSKLFDNTDIAFQIEGLTSQLEELKLTGEWRQNLLRIFKEGMTNILKHADGCTAVSLVIVCRDNQLQIKLQDDGIGFNPQHSARGNGLKNMRERAERINGRLKVFSEPKEGTQIIFEGKLP
ncbi:MAG: hypothetical protein GXO77_05505 [Calditrichaeota bacterium]|nr:hypothetical protein [Calditrichota bacterium]